MESGQPDRAPLFAEGLRKDVLATWRGQGMPRNAALPRLFLMDKREEVEAHLWPIPMPATWPTNLDEVEEYSRRLDPDDPKRLPKNWSRVITKWRRGAQVRMLYVHHGFFESAGVEGWSRFHELMYLVKDDPAVIRQMLDLQGQLNARLVARMLEEVEVEAAVFSEPIGANHGPLISPEMYRELALPGYQPILAVLRDHRVRTIILRTYANCRALIPALLEAGFNCLWAVEVFGYEMDYRELRREFGTDLRLIGGIDLDVLREGKEAIRREVETKVPPLLAQGGYAPLADGRVRADVPWENYRYYRKLLEQAASGN
ncbi:MAG: uroporphyrinogen decarboxylase family protein [Anaerolineales bacterium]|jgi:uroporphyrinogen decarboxylase|nr:uroporphyrinogen decarboxylase family protein [Anaerolineales bacterium]